MIDLRLTNCLSRIRYWTFRYHDSQVHASVSDYRRARHNVVPAFQELGLVDSFRERVCHHILCASEEHLNFVV